jgi:putative addiction module CopG family antidote
MVTRLEDDLADAVDEMVAAGAFSSRSEAVRAGLRLLLDQRRRQEIGEAIVEGYRRHPLTPEELAAAERRGIDMINEEPW